MMIDSIFVVFFKSQLCSLQLNKSISTSLNGKHRFQRVSTESISTLCSINVLFL